MCHKDEIFLSYVTGFLDGEGCINIKRKHKKGDFSGYGLRTVICNTNLKVLEYIKSKLGGCLIETNKKQLKTSSKKLYKLTFADSKAKELLEKIFPFLIVKRDQAEWAIKVNFSPNFRPTSIKEFKNREVIRNKIHLLNLGTRSPQRTWKGNSL